MAVIKFHRKTSIKTARWLVRGTTQPEHHGGKGTTEWQTVWNLVAEKSEADYGQLPVAGMTAAATGATMTAAATLTALVINNALQLL